MIRYYLGVEVHVVEEAGAPDGWAWATWEDGREFLHWIPQLRKTPWG